MESCSVCPSVTGFFHLASCPQVKVAIRLYTITLSAYLFTFPIPCLLPPRLHILLILQSLNSCPAPSWPFPTLQTCSGPRVFALPVFLPGHSSPIEHDYLSPSPLSGLCSRIIFSVTAFQDSPLQNFSIPSPSWSFLDSFLNLFSLCNISPLCVYYLFLYTRVKAT